eukprot:1692941-Rhodomonas_salina.2
MTRRASTHNRVRSMLRSARKGRNHRIPRPEPSTETLAGMRLTWVALWVRLARAHWMWMS